MKVVLILFCVFLSSRCHLQTDNTFWTQLAHQELVEALNVKWNLGDARNVILFIGDGMGPNTVTATRIYKGGESHRLFYEKFPHVGLLKTYSADYMVPDSAATATAMFSGVKVNQNTVGVDARVAEGDCPASLDHTLRLKSLATIALEAGKSTGLVTTMRVTHATPGPIYAHSPNRRWECEATMPAEAAACKDIARQLVEDHPGKDLHVIMGGGRQVLVTNVTGDASDPIDTWACNRKDGRDLITDYKKDKESRGLKYSVLSNNEDLQNLDVDKTDYVLGIFANGHLKLEHERDQGPEGMPSISDMVAAAIKVLRKNTKGYFLMVEGGNIDMSHHRGKARRAIDEAAAMEEAVRLAANITDEEDTLLIVTSDHSHTLTINGYTKRGSDILSIAQQSPKDGVNYTTLTYGTGGPGSNQYFVNHDGDTGTVSRQDPSQVDTTSFEYEQLAAVEADENYHGGGDVVVYARGPQSHLFHNVHEQHYVFHVICHAARMGAYSSGRALIPANLAVIVAVEGGNIDMSHHRGKARRAIDEAAAMEEAVRLAANITDEEDTLLIVTSDHSHTLTINGYTKRGSDILSIAQQSPKDGVNYTTLTYGTGGPGSNQYFVNHDGDTGTVSRQDPSQVDTTSFEYEQLAAVEADENYHGGGDVVVYARGPQSHLFHNVHEQHYVFHVIIHAARMGAYSSGRALIPANLAVIVAVLCICYSAIFG